MASQKARTEQKQSLPAHAWKPGQCGNPNGRPSTPPEIKQIRAEKSSEIVHICKRMATMMPDEIARIASEGGFNCLEQVIATLWVKSMNGSTKHTNLLFERLAGAVPKVFVTQDKEGNEAPIESLNVHVSTDKLLAIMVKLNELPEDEECKLIPNLLESSQESSAPSSEPQSATAS